MSEKRTYDQVKYSFTPEELRQLGAELAQEVQIVFNLRAEKKTVVSTLDSQIKATEKKVSDLTSRVNLGSELRDVEVMILLETPRPGMKRIIRVDNNEVVRELPMTSQEMMDQSSFGFEPGRDDEPIDGKSAGAGERPED